MNNRNQSLDESLKEEFKRAGAQTQREVDAAGVEHISDEQKERIHAKLREQIAAYENEKIYAKLSEEDRKALELGKEMMRKQEQETEKMVVVHKKKRVRGYLVLAAAIILAMALGVTSIGGPKRIIKMMTSAVGDREVEQTDSDENNKVIEKEREEEAYQQIKDVFGMDPVKLIWRPAEMKFDTLEVDEVMQTAEIYYKYNDANVIFCMSTTYTKASWGIDTEDDVINKYSMKKGKVDIEMKEYEIKGTKERRFSSKFSYKGIEYYLIGTMENDKFEKIVENLYFS